MDINKTIYLDYQSTTPVDPKVLEDMMPYFSEEFGNPHSSDHIMGWNASKAIGLASQQVANMIGSNPDEVIFTSGATESNNLALLGLARKNNSPDRRKIFIGATEHKCVLAAADSLKVRLGYEVALVPVNSDGVVDLHWLKRNVDERTLLVSIMAVNNEIGTIAPIAQVSEICRSQGVVFHCDAAQSPYAMDIDQLTDHVDLASFSAHKMYGPKGIGALYVKSEIQSRVEPLIYGGGQQNNLRSGTIPTALVVGFGSAAKAHSSGWGESYKNNIMQLRQELWNSIQTIFPYARLNGPALVDRHPGNLNVRFCGWEAHDLLLRLQPMLAASTGSACSSGIEQSSHVLRSIGLSDQAASSSIRFSLGRYSKHEEMMRASEVISSLLS